MESNQTKFPITDLMGILQPSTITLYVSEIAKYWNEIFPDIRFDPLDIDVQLWAQNLNNSTLRTHLDAIQFRNPLISPSGLAHARSALVWLAREMANESLLGEHQYLALRNVKIPQSNYVKRNGRTAYISPNEGSRLLKAVNLLGNDERIQVRNLPLVMLALINGLRRSEIVAIKWADIHQNIGGHTILRVHGKGAKHRLLKLGSNVGLALAKWRNIHPDPSPSNFVFVVIGNKSQYMNPLTGGYVYYVVTQLSHLAGIQFVRPHDLRRSFARNSFEKGVPIESIQGELGHSNPAMTEIYINPRIEVDHTASDCVATWLNINTFRLEL